MTSVNPHFTLRYSQPEDYRFSHDSVFLARRVFEILRSENLRGWRVLDLCSGSGIIGMDFLFHLREAGLAMPSRFDFLDVQGVYWDHFLENRGRLGEVLCDLHFFNLNYERLLQPEFANAYDLILCNPPFFTEGSGKLSPSEFKNRCRFFLDSDPDSLFEAVAHSLKPSGSAFVLVREIPKVLPSQLKLEQLPDIRGTNLLRLIKPVAQPRS